MPSQVVSLANETGLHARPAKAFADAARASGHQVHLTKDGSTINARSVLSVLTLDCHQGDEITINVEGDDADTVLRDLVALVESGLGEHEGTAT